MWVLIGCGGLLVSLIISAVVFDVLIVRPRHMLVVREVVCQSNMKRVALALLMYADNNKWQLPPAKNWCDAILPYIKTEEILHCPSDPKNKYSYAMNSNLSGIALKKIKEPALVVLVFESTKGSKNTADAGTSLPTEPPSILMATIMPSSMVMWNGLR